MAAIAGGDREAFSLAVMRFARSLANYAYRMLGNEAEAEDVTQEAMFRLWTQAERWDPARASLSTWLHRITHNLCIDLIRKNRLLTGQDDERLDDESNAAGHEEAFDQGAMSDRLHAAIATLPERQRSALVLTHFQGLSNRDVAIILDISVGALESLLARARRQLKCLLIDTENAGGAHL